MLSSKTAGEDMMSTERVVNVSGATVTSVALSRFAMSHPKSPPCKAGGSYAEDEDDDELELEKLEKLEELDELEKELEDEDELDESELEEELECELEELEDLEDELEWELEELELDDARYFLKPSGQMCNGGQAAHSPSCRYSPFTQPWHAAMGDWLGSSHLMQTNGSAVEHSSIFHAGDALPPSAATHAVNPLNPVGRYPGADPSDHDKK
jgi:hypothetical protein